MKRPIYLIFMLALVLAGCKTQKTVTPLAPTVLNHSDSVKVETVINTVYVPVEVAVDFPEQSESIETLNDSSHVETDLAFSDAWITDGILHHLIKNKKGKLTDTSYIPQTSEKTTKETVSVREIPIPTPYPVEVEKSLTLIERIKITSFWYLLAVALCGVGYIFRKPLISVIHRFI